MPKLKPSPTAVAVTYFLDEITPMVVTYNKQANIARTLTRFDWDRRILVVDSGSTDATLEIVRFFRRADVIHPAI
jgi:GT2 family glycosyltransferase